MAAITVPEKYAGGLSRIKNLSPEEVDAVVLALERASLGGNGEIFSLLRPVLPSFKAKDLKELVEALRSLYSARTGMDVPIEEFAAGLVAAIRIRDDKDLRASDQAELDRLEATFKRLLNVRPLSMIAKAKDLLYDHENTFCSARVITDMRPVFDSNVNEPPTGIVITHTLKIEYHRSGKHTEIHIAVDKDDIESLLSVLLRAQEKSETLSAILNRTELLKLCE